MEEYKIDFNALIEQMVNSNLNQILIGAIPADDNVKQQFYKILTGFNKRGVSTQTVLDVFIEAFKEE